MAKHMNKGLDYRAWPTRDRECFVALHAPANILDRGPWFTLSETSIRNRRYGYGQWLGYISAMEPGMLDLPPGARITRDTIRGYVGTLRRNCTETAVAICLQRLRLTISEIAPEDDWSWLYRIERRVANGARRLPTPRATSADLYKVGLDLIHDARNKSEIFDRPILSQAEQFRDGLMVAFLVEAPLRRGCFANLRLGEHVFKVGNRWNVFVSAEMTKTGEPQDYEISLQLGGYLDEFLEKYRPVFPCSDQHGGLWPYGDRPMTDKMVRRYIRKHTEQRLGTAISPHGFRRGSATFIAEADPKNIRMAKDLLGHRTFGITEKHYIAAAGSRLAGKALADLILTKRSSDR